MAKMCPFISNHETKQACVEAKCGLWTGKGDFAACAITTLNSIGYNMHKLSQGGGSSFEDDFDENDFGGE